MVITRSLCRYTTAAAERGAKCQHRQIRGGGSTYAQGYLMMGGGDLRPIGGSRATNAPPHQIDPRVRSMNVNKGGISWLLFVTVSERNIL